MKTEMMLLIQTDGRPTLSLPEIAQLLGVGSRTVQNKIYERRLPFPVFKLGDSGEWVAHISDVAGYIDSQRDEATKLLQKAREAA
jgi:predicted DNA-binding transcriptional regulator AlpA